MTRWSALALFLICACTVLIPAEEQKAPESYAIVAGTVFRDPGYALPDAKVVLIDSKEKKRQNTVTNYRGEFSFRVPPREAKYVVRATMKGYRPGQKEAAINGADHIDVNLVLVPESK